MNTFPFYHTSPFRDILINSKFLISLRKLKFNQNNFWKITKEDVEPIYEALESIQKGDKIIMYQEPPFVFVNKNGISNKIFRPILSKVFCGYSHYDFIDFLIELTIFHRIGFPMYSNENKIILRKLSQFYPNEKNIFDELLKY